MDNNKTCLRETEEIFKSLNSRISQLQSERREQYEERESVYSKRSSRSKSSCKSGKSSHYSISSLGKAEMLAKAARLGAELKFHDIESEKVAALKRQESDIKKLQMIKELTATTAEIEAEPSSKKKITNAISQKRKIPIVECTNIYSRN